MAENKRTDFVQPAHFAFDAESEAAIPPIAAQIPAGQAGERGASDAVSGAGPDEATDRQRLGADGGHG